MEFHDVNSRMGYIGFGSTGNTTLHFDNETGGNFHFLNGNIGLGIANPGNYKLAIHGTSSSYSTIKLTNDGNASNGIQFGNTSSNSNDGEAWNFENGFFRIGTNNQERLRVTSSGNVGIGTTSPSFKLTVNTADEKHLRFENGSEQSFLLLKDDGNLNLWVHGDDDMIFTRGTGGGTESMRITSSGSLGIGTTSTGSHKLAVEGTIGAREIKVEATGWSDFVFEKDYKLKSLEEVETHITEKGHLPEVPSEAEVRENGINLGEMDAKLLQKIEELTLYLIEQNKEIQALKAKNVELEKRLVDVEK